MTECLSSLAAEAKPVARGASGPSLEAALTGTIGPEPDGVEADGPAAVPGGADRQGDPVAANLMKVIRILDKHKLADGLDLRYLRDSIGFEHGVNRRQDHEETGKKPDEVHLGTSEAEAGLSNKALNGRHADGPPKVAPRRRPVARRRPPRTVDDHDGSYLFPHPACVPRTVPVVWADDDSDSNDSDCRNCLHNGTGPAVEKSAFRRVTTDHQSRIKDATHPVGTGNQDKSGHGNSSSSSAGERTAGAGISPFSDSGRGSTRPSTQPPTAPTHSDLPNPPQLQPVAMVTSNSGDDHPSDTAAASAHACADAPKGRHLDNTNDARRNHGPNLDVDYIVGDSKVNGIERTNGGHGEMYGSSDNLGDSRRTEPASAAQQTSANVGTGVEEFKAFYWKIEMEEWTRINRLLRQHGLPCVEVLHPRKAAQTSDVVMFDPETARTLRHTLQTLMKDCDRRQGLVQELILTNNQLREHLDIPDDETPRRELGEQTSSTEKYETRARDLKLLLDSSKSKIEELEDERQRDSGHQVSEEERLRNTKAAIQSRCYELQKKVEDQSQQIDSLRAELQHMRQEEQKLRKKHDEAFNRLKKQVPKNAKIDEKTLNVIDSYERQIFNLRKQLDGKDNKSADSAFEEATPNYRSLIKSYEREVREAKRKAHNLEDENELLRLDMQARPELKEFRQTQQRVKKLERILKSHNIRITEGVTGPKQENDQSKLTNTGSMKVKGAPLPAYSTQLEDIDFLPAEHCRHYLRLLCEQLGVTDVEQLIPAMRKQARALDALPGLEQFAREVLTVVATPGMPIPPHLDTGRMNQHTGGKEGIKSSSHEVWCEKSWHHVLPTLRHWVTQLTGLEDLQKGLAQLTVMIPVTDGPSLQMAPPSVAAMLTTVQGMLSDDITSISQKGGKAPTRSKEQPPRSVLQGIVDHFMTLFDVSRISGVYARMNDIYSKLGEVHNVMKTLRNLLGLADDVRSSVVVDSIARLCQTHNKTTEDHLRQLLGVQDLNSVVRKLQEHQEFFPVFQEIMSKLMEICDCKRMDQVIPTVRALKLLAG